MIYLSQELSSISDKPLSEYVEDRDPKNIAEHIRVSFEDVLAEPEDVHSFEKVWDDSYQCFICSEGFFYKLLSAISGCCIAVYWGIEFGCYSFSLIWCLSPALWQYNIIIGTLYKYCSLTVECCCVPFFELCSMCFGNNIITVYNSHKV